ncbi:LpqB family beta-propeller domain-containing protein [Dactylosporangium sp. NPDC051484]|uniref:LpqB family beta-propeller domain-containing protein n=1 Tax=Dactylosporangium sp. NPDC051484 TaxID=3154942 RepID=UPI00344B734E
MHPDRPSPARPSAGRARLRGSTPSGGQGLRATAAGLPRRVAGRTALAAVLGLALGLTGCGLPSRTAPKYAGPPKSAATAHDEAKAPPRPTDTTTASGLLSQFLQSSVGGNMGGDGEQKTANNDTRDWLRQFMTDDLAARWNPQPGLTIVKDPTEFVETELGNGQFTVKVTLQPIGKLTDSGEFQINTQTADPITLTSTARTVVGGQLRLSGNVPDQLYLTVTGLKAWYDWQPIYFWELGAGQGKLVPDLRYMPRTLLQTKRAGQVLDWLRHGPSQWLQGVAAPLSEAVEFKGTPVIENGVVKVNLSGKATKIPTEGPEFTRLVRQIRWSLSTGPDHPAVRLTIENQSNDASSDGWLEDNVAAGLPTSTPDKYYVSGGTVRAVGSDTGAGLFAPGGSNTQVVSAAINREGSKAALVRQVSKNQQQLFVSSDEQGPPKYEPVDVSVDVSVGRLSRPAWMNYPERRLLISDGKLLWVSTDASARKFLPVELSNALQIGSITAFAVAPEGHRIALIADAKLIVAALQLVNGKLTIGSPQQIYTSLRNNQGVGWLTETTLVVGGAPSPTPPNGVLAYSLVAITVDGAEEDVLPAGATRPASQTDVSKVVVRTNNPRDSLSFAWPRMPVTAMVESNGVAREVYRDSFGPLSLGESTPTTTPSGEQPANPTAPFYPDY